MISIALSAILVPLYGVLLCKNQRGSKFQMVRNVAAWLLATNVAEIINYSTWDYYKGSYVVFWVFNTIMTWTFNVGHWLFAREYVEMAANMEHVLEGAEVPGN